MPDRLNKEAAVHFYGLDRICYLLEFGSLVRSIVTKWRDGVEHVIFKKVIVGWVGRSKVGYDLSVFDDFLGVAFASESDSVEISKTCL